ncbi:MAG: hypothetical protein AAFN51_11055 [Pseudomonadota bacterium]
MPKFKETPIELSDDDLDAVDGGSKIDLRKINAGHFKVEIEGVTQGALKDSFEVTNKIVGSGGGNDI